MEIIRVAKERQAAEAAKNASNLLEELDREKNLEESKKAAAARKREKKKRKKMEKLAEKGLLPPDQGNLFLKYLFKLSSQTKSFSITYINAILTLQLSPPCWSN